MMRIWQWLDANHKPVQALTAILAGLLALGTVVTVKWQMDAAARLQKEQSARDIYREYLNISMSKPEFAEPDYCQIAASPRQYAGYESYIAYLLYTSEQVFALGDGWDEVMQAEIEPHAEYLCSADFQRDDYDAKVQRQTEIVRKKQCSQQYYQSMQEILSFTQLP
jgi:hypothetical protein